MTASKSICKWIKPSTLSWIILIVAITNTVFLGGKRRAFGGFVAQFHKDFRNITLMELNFIGNLYSAVGHMFSGVMTIVLLYFDRQYRLFQILGAIFIIIGCITSSFVPNPHWLFLTHTLLSGLGSTFILSVTALLVIEYFDTKHPYRIMATSLVNGGSISSIVFVPLFAYLIQQFNWRNTFLIIGLVYFIVIGLSAVFFEQNDDLDEIESIKYNFRLKDIKCPQIPLMILWFFDKVITSVVIFGLLMNLTDYIYRNQTNLVQSSLLTTMFATGEGVSFITTAIVTGLSQTFLNGKLGLFLIFASSATCVVLITMEFTKESLALMRFLCFMAGLGLGFSNTLAFPASEELTRLPAHISNMFSLLALGTGMAISPFLTGLLAELFQYKWFFLIQGMLILIKVICITSITMLLRCYNKYDVNIEYDNQSKITEIEIEDDLEPIDETTKLIQKNVDK